MGPSTKYRLSANDLLDTLDNWNSLMNFRVHLIACGGTALTLLKIKDSTRDIDFTVPMQKEYDRLMKFLRDLGYEEKGGGLAHNDDPHFIYQVWRGNKVFTTDLLDPPLDPGNNIPIKRWSHIYLGVLNLKDLIMTKMFRGTSVDRDDCIAAFATGQVKAEELLERYSETARYDLNPKKMMKNFVYLAEGLRELKLVSEEFLEKVRSCV